MFAILKKVTSYIWSNAKNDSDEFISDEKLVEIFKGSERYLEEWKETQNFSGKITGINEVEKCGVINYEIHFDFKLVNGGASLSIGDHVTGCSVRYHEDDGWIATSVFPSNEDWENEDDNFKISSKQALDYRKSDIAIISEKDDEKIIFNNNYELKINELSLEFVAIKGDWVKIEKTDNENGNLYLIKPLRKCKISGKVTRIIHKGVGVINNQIVYTNEICSNGFCPNRGDFVDVVAIESNQFNYEWRALTVCPKQSNSRKSVSSKSSDCFEVDQPGLEIPSPLDFHSVCFGDEKYLTVHIRNTGTFVHKLLNCRLHENYFGANQFYIEKPVIDNENGADESYPVFIFPGKTIHIDISCIASQLGKNEQILLFEFDGFTIRRITKVNVTDAAQNILVSNQPYQAKHKHFDILNNRWSSRSCLVIPGEKPWRPRNRFSSHLPVYLVPNELWDVVLEDRNILQQCSVLTEELSAENYINKFDTMLYLEEIQMEIEMKEFNLSQVCLQVQNEYLALEVPGLAENRPSLLVGDKITLTNPMETSGPIYEGFIHEVYKDKVLIKFNSSFHNLFQGESYDVEFHFNRTPMRRCHQAVRQSLELTLNVLFPSKLTYKSPQIQNDVSSVDTHYSSPLLTDGKNDECINANNNHDTSCMRWYNAMLNDRQRVAVRRILRGECRPIPYIIFGPPGTGKTITIVEAILQIFKKITSSRILCCTPSNSAADLIVERLIRYGVVSEADLVRYNAFQRNQEVISESIKSYCKKEDIRLIIHHRIIVCTCVTAATLYGLGLRANHFTHLFIDEAGQATEPESLIAIGLVACAEGQVVLAGDPMQLGPILRSPYAKQCGLQISYLERIMSLDLYQRNPQKYKNYGNYNPLLVTKLVNSYRSHEDIISLPSSLFYNSELICCTPKCIQEMFCDWKELPKQHLPLIFHGIRGADYREGNSPSWFNPFEVMQVVKYLKEFYALGIESNDIGIITPYRKQVEKIRYMMNITDLEMCKVGSVEEFQGQERLIIIISTVRACDELLKFDIVHNLGFLTNPKRFNVAITRARSLLIVIGDPNLLVHDEYWKQLLGYCLRNGAYRGCLFQSSDTEI